MLARIHTGMTVYDRRDEEIGTVKHVQFGEGQTAAGPDIEQHAEFDVVQPLHTVKQALSPERPLPQELSQRLARTGYIQIDPGLLASSLYAMPGQIERVSENAVRLRVAEDDLLKA